VCEHPYQPLRFAKIKQEKRNNDLSKWMKIKKKITIKKRMYRVEGPHNRPTATKDLSDTRVSFAGIAEPPIVPYRKEHNEPSIFRCIAKEQVPQ
jgi:hypothetical protein